QPELAMFTFALTPAVIFELYSNSFEYRGINNWRNWNLDPLFAWHGDARGSARLRKMLPDISILAIYSGATVLLSAYGAKAEFMTLSDFDNTAVVNDLNDLGVPTPKIFATPLKVGIYLFTTDSGQLGYGASGLNNSNALSTTTDLGWMRIDIAPSAQVTKFGLLVGLPGPKQHNHEAVLFFDNYT